MSAPGFKVRGCDTSRAPRALVPYLDCVDGAVVAGGSFEPVTGRQIDSTWVLYRGGQPVGRVTVEGGPSAAPVPYVERRPDLGLIIRPRARRQGRRWSSVWPMVLIGAILGVIFWTALLVLGARLI